ncbi:AraC family transcriptional regulator [Maricaulis parjimensis]|uniref:AraC family transcriptional regulator n=1 Tax=Maricaulis parjimensis TaxID=144023 RepID=UPI00193A1445|nr:AraC family transcriptional regulator [Maricaulis parjimensis]
MRPDNRARYADRIDRVLAHIEAADAPESLDLSTLAGIAALSPFHFHRVFRLMTGETPAETLRRVRLARSLPELASESVSITQAAGAAGYSTSQSFARAVRASTGGTASEVRADPSRIKRLLKPLETGAAMPIEIVSTDPLRLLAIRNVGAYAELNQTYEALFGRVFATAPMEALRGIWGVWHEDPRYADPDTLEFDCAIDVGDLPAPNGIEILDVEAGRHARLRHVGDYDSLHDSIDRLYASMIDAGEELADRQLIVNYVDDPESRPAEEWRSDIYLPLA